jgi:hypothetical protein
MTTETRTVKKKITAYQLFGWTPLLVTMVGAGIVVAISVLQGLGE